ncbi:hypothetical protein N7478_005837 [Penicillium angulare]|uniref:uncharacterized protein n=1 Tax=Penicillium angulare TaxID=116970 RepID=UPI002540B481|nr:uncharacterized protein N7478_005837 [Penicillium angulare]KAJ5280465.1 hypothetical protein N7478_005837 [Penicillium angulare]
MTVDDEASAIDAQMARLRAQLGGLRKRRQLLELESQVAEEEKLLQEAEDKLNAFRYPTASPLHSVEPTINSTRVMVDAFIDSVVSPQSEQPPVTNGSATNDNTRPVSTQPSETPKQNGAAARVSPSTVPNKRPAASPTAVPSGAYRNDAVSVSTLAPPPAKMQKVNSPTPQNQPQQPNGQPITSAKQVANTTPKPEITGSNVKPVAQQATPQAISNPQPQKPANQVTNGSVAQGNSLPAKLSTPVSQFTALPSTLQQVAPGKQKPDLLESPQVSQHITPTLSEKSERLRNKISQLKEASHGINKPDQQPAQPVQPASPQSVEKEGKVYVFPPRPPKIPLYQAKKWDECQKFFTGMEAHFLKHPSFFPTDSSRVDLGVRYLAPEFRFYWDTFAEKHGKSWNTYIIFLSHALARDSNEKTATMLFTNGTQFYNQSVKDFAIWMIQWEPHLLFNVKDHMFHLKRGLLPSIRAKATLSHDKFDNYLSYVVYLQSIENSIVERVKFFGGKQPNFFITNGPQYEVEEQSNTHSNERPAAKPEGQPIQISKAKAQENAKESSPPTKPGQCNVRRPGSPEIARRLGGPEIAPDLGPLELAQGLEATGRVRRPEPLELAPHRGVTELAPHPCQEEGTLEDTEVHRRPEDQDPAHHLDVAAVVRHPEPPDIARERTQESAHRRQFTRIVLRLSGHQVLNISQT